MKCTFGALGPASSVKRPPAGPQCETIGGFQPMRSSDLTTWADGPTLPTRNRQSAPAFFRRVSCGTTSTSSPPNFSMPAAFMPLALSAAVRPFSFDSPQGLFTRIMPQLFALKVFCEYCSIARSTISSTAETRKTKFGLVPFFVIGVPAAHGPIIGTFASLTIGTMAIDTGVSRPPNSTATFSLNSSSRAAITPLAGVASSSRRTSSSFLPSTPPLALISSMATARPRVMASPARADWPESAVTRPILMVSCENAGQAASEIAIAAKSRRIMFISLFEERSVRAIRMPAPYGMLIFPHGSEPLRRAADAGRDRRDLPQAAHDSGSGFGARLLRAGAGNPLHRQSLDARSGRSHRLQQGALQVGEEEIR